MMQFAPLIILLPMLAFPVIYSWVIFSTQSILEGYMKEGGIIALVVMAAA